MKGAKPVVSVWRDAIRDSRDLDSTAKLVGFVLSTYMDRHGHAWPAVDTLASGCSLSDTAVRHATSRLEQAGFLVVQRSRGGKRATHAYVAILPVTANHVRRQEWETASTSDERRSPLQRRNGEPDALNGEPDALNAEPGSPESAESAESRDGGGAWGAAPPLKNDWTAHPEEGDYQ